MCIIKETERIVCLRTNLMELEWLKHRCRSLEDSQL